MLTLYIHIYNTYMIQKYIIYSMQKTLFETFQKNSVKVWFFKKERKFIYYIYSQQKSLKNVIILW